MCGGSFNATGDCRLMYAVKYPLKVKFFVTLVISPQIAPIERTAVAPKALAMGFAGAVFFGAAAPAVTFIAPVGPTTRVAA
jgi:hypothetical protein